MPRQSVIINGEAPQITVRQGRPTVTIELAQPRVSVVIPEPEVIITWPDSTLNVIYVTPGIEVRIPEPVVTVNMPEPLIELTIGGADPTDLVELEDGRFAPEGVSEADLEPQEPERNRAKHSDHAVPTHVYAPCFCAISALKNTGPP